jgi:hypothetical protein
MRYLVLFFCMVVSAFADRLKLNNGTTVEGAIIAETGAEYIVERSLAGGTIKAKDTIRKSDVAEVTRATAEEKAAAAMKEAYEATKRYQLNPENSFAKDYYEQVLNGSFRKFLADYPDSPFAAEVRERIASWEAERDTVAAGRIKFRGQWLDAGQANDLREQERAQQVIAQAQAFAAQGRFQEAIQLLQPLRTAKPSALVEEASRHERQFYVSWQNYLGARLKNITSEIEIWEKRLQDAAAAADRARQNQTTWMKTHHEGIAGYKGFLAQYEGAIQQAEAEQKTCTVRLTQLKDEAVATQQKLNELQARATERGVEFSPPEPGLATKLIALAKQYWLYGLGGLLVLWLILRRR